MSHSLSHYTQWRSSRTHCRCCLHLCFNNMDAEVVVVVVVVLEGGVGGVGSPNAMMDVSLSSFRRLHKSATLTSVLKRLVSGGLNGNSGLVLAASVSRRGCRRRWRCWWGDGGGGGVERGCFFFFFLFLFVKHCPDTTLCSVLQHDPGSDY